MYVEYDADTDYIFWLKPIYLKFCMYEDTQYQTSNYEYFFRTAILF